MINTAVVILLGSLTPRSETNLDPAGTTTAAPLALILSYAVFVAIFRYSLRDGIGQGVEPPKGQPERWVIVPMAIRRILGRHC